MAEVGGAGAAKILVVRKVWIHSARPLAVFPVDACQLLSSFFRKLFCSS
jgi:hypothetical protein